MFAENDGILCGIDIVPCQINQPLKRCCVQMQMNGADAMIQHAGLNVVSLLKYQSFYICFKTYMPHVLLMNIKYSARYVVPWLKNIYQI